MKAETVKQTEETASVSDEYAQVADLGNTDLKYIKARRRFLNVWTVVGSIGIAAVVLYLLGILSIPVGIIIWTTIIVFALRSPVNWFEKRGINRAVGTTLAFILMAIVFAALALLMFSPVFGIGEQFRSLVESIPGYFESLQSWYNSMYDQYAHIFQDDTVRNWIDQLTGALSAWASDTAKMSAEGIVNLGGSVANSFLAIGFALVVAFWILMDLPKLGKECWRLIGEKRRESAEMLHLTVTRVMGGYIKATLLQCLLIGAGCAVAYTIIGVPNAAALGGIAGVLNIIPVIGPWLGGAMAALVGVFVSPWVALIALIVTIVIQQFVYTFIGPKLMADSVDVHPAMVFVALFAGSALGGAMGGLLGSLLGMLASIPAVAAAKAIFVYYFEKRTGRHLVSEDGVFFRGTPSDGAMSEIASLAQTAHDKESKLKKTSLWKRFLHIQEDESLDLPKEDTKAEVPVSEDESNQEKPAQED